MQGRLIDNRCYFACDFIGCKFVFHTNVVIWLRAVQQVRAAGWYTESLGGAKYTHRCPVHAAATTPLRASTADTVAASSSASVAPKA